MVFWKLAININSLSRFLYLWYRARKTFRKKGLFESLTTKISTKKDGRDDGDLEKQGLSEEEIKKRVDSFMRFNSIHQDTEYRYEYILKRKGFIKEAVNLSSSRSLVEGGMWASEKIEREMDDIFRWSGNGDYIKEDDYSLLELLICGMMIEYSPEIKRKKYDEVVRMIKNYFSNRPYYHKYLKGEK